MTNAARYSQYYNLQSEFDELYSKSLNGDLFHNLTESITSKANLLLAYRTIKSNTGRNTKGTDGLTIKDYKVLDEDSFITRIQNRFSDFKPDSIRRVFIDKANGSKRPLGIPSMEDRLIQQAIKQVLEPICEAKFYKHSYGFRPNRSTHHAIGRATNLMNVGKCHFVVDIDIKGFFDNVSHNKLIRQLYTLGIRDKQLLAVIKKMLRAEIIGEGIPSKGVPQGGILSPLLSNVVLNELDQWISDQWENFNTRISYPKNSNKWRALKKTNLKEGWLVRYADDFKVFTKDRQSAEKWFYAIKDFLKNRLGLDISKEKSKITNLRKRKTEFLGFTLRAVKKKNSRVAYSHISDKKMENIIQSLRDRTKQLWSNHKQKEAYLFNSYIRGVHNYFQIASHVSCDMKIIAYRVHRCMWNRLKKRGQYGQFKARGYERYNYHTFKIGDVPLIPVPAIKSTIPLSFNQNITDYTPIGRALNAKTNLIYNMQKAVNVLAKSYISGRSIQYNDNRISKFSAARGKCHITGIDLTSDLQYYHCHHKTPIHLGGTDEFDNLVVLHKLAHILVHAQTDETIERYMRILNLNEKQIKKLNKLRKACNLEPINQQLTRGNAV